MASGSLRIGITLHYPYSCPRRGKPDTPDPVEHQQQNPAQRPGGRARAGRALPVPLVVLVQFVADRLEGLPPATEVALLERAAQGLPGGKARGRAPPRTSACRARRPV